MAHALSSEPAKRLVAPRAAPPFARIQMYVSAVDRHLLLTGARQHGISQGEFLRRVLHDVRMGWIKHGLYTLPTEQELQET